MGATLADGTQTLDEIRKVICEPIAGAPAPPAKACKRVPIGEVDSVGGGLATGWAYDPDKPNRSIRIDFYADAPYADPPAPGGALIGSAYANQPSNAINADQAITGKHRFEFNVPPQYFGKQVFAHAIDAVRLSENPVIWFGGANFFVHPTECADGSDNDNDGQSDMADPQCSSSADKTERPDCSDGIDNDGDGSGDYVGIALSLPADPNCGYWGFGYEGDSPASNCSDGIDNDGDAAADATGLVDPAGKAPPDAGCSSAMDTAE